MTIQFEYPLEIMTGPKTSREIILLVEATYHQAERGERDSFGAPLEPDYEAYFELSRVTGPDGRVYLESDLPDEWDLILDAAGDHMPERVEMRRDAYFSLFGFAADPTGFTAMPRSFDIV